MTVRFREAGERDKIEKGETEMREYTTKESTHTTRYIYKCSHKHCKGIKAVDVVVHHSVTKWYDPETNQGGSHKPIISYNGDSQLIHLHCPICNEVMYGDKVQGYTTNHICDARCTGAVGKICECSCGGANHGSAHL